MEVDLTNVPKGTPPDIRHLNDMNSVVFDKEWLKSASNLKLYYMYRGIEEKDGLRYDITIVPAKMLGSEFVKTKGHYHVGAWQELYTVLEGEAIFLMQKKNGEGKIEDVYAVKAEKGNFVIMPPFYGHVTINSSETQDLKMANWISPECKSEYSDFEKLVGACYYYILQSDSGQASWIKNENYKSVPELRFEEPLKSAPEDLSFLKNS
jgi:glucose-6-phosphate isomerase